MSPQEKTTRDDQIRNLFLSIVNCDELLAETEKRLGYPLRRDR